MGLENCEYFEFLLFSVLQRVDGYLSQIEFWLFRSWFSCTTFSRSIAAAAQEDSLYLPSQYIRDQRSRRTPKMTSS